VKTFLFSAFGKGKNQGGRRLRGGILRGEESHMKGGTSGGFLEANGTANSRRRSRGANNLVVPFCSWSGALFIKMPGGKKKRGEEEGD